MGEEVVGRERKDGGKGGRRKKEQGQEGGKKTKGVRVEGEGSKRRGGIRRRMKERER